MTFEQFEKIFEENGLQIVGRLRDGHTDAEVFAVTGKQLLAIAECFYNVGVKDGFKEEGNRCPCDCPAYKDGYKVGVTTATQRMIEVACDAYCAVCDTQECGESGVECNWVKKFRTVMNKKSKES